MPTRAPGERPKEGETIQEHDLEHRRERRDRLVRDQDHQAPTKPKAPTKRETWVDWLGDEPEPDELFTRSEVVDHVNALIRPGMTPVKETDIQRWEKFGILPRPVRRRHGDAQYALYPDWYAPLVKQVRKLQRQGYALDEIKPQLRAYARMTLGVNRNEIDDEIFGNVKLPEDLFLSPKLTGELERLGDQWSRIAGVPAERIEVHVIGTNGQATAYPLRLVDQEE